MSDRKEGVAVKFDWEVICAGLLRMISDVRLLEKFNKYIDAEFMFYGDKSPKVMGFRKLTNTITRLCNDTKPEKMTLQYIDSMVKNLANTEDGLEAYNLFVWMRSDETVAKKTTDDGCFDIFLDYLKVTNLLKWSGPFMKEYREGHIGSAIESMRDLLPVLDQIKTSEDYRFSIHDLDKLLPVESEAIGDILYFDCPALDGTMGGFEKQTLNLFITVTNGGKSMMAQHIIRQCVRMKKSVHITVVEDRPKTFARRLIASVTGIPIKRLKNNYNQLSSEEMALIEKAKQEIQQYVYVDFVYGESIDSIHKRKLDHDHERKMRGEKPYLVDIVDYTAHIAQFSFGDKKYEKVHSAYVSRKNFALKHEKICFDFAQINREGTHKHTDNHLLTHADLAASFDLSQVCDNIISVNRNAKDRDVNEAILHVCKGRDEAAGGKYRVKTDFARARWDMTEARWESASRDEIAMSQAVDEVKTGGDL